MHHDLVQSTQAFKAPYPHKSTSTAFTELLTATDDFIVTYHDDESNESGETSLDAALPSELNAFEDGDELRGKMHESSKHAGRIHFYGAHESNAGAIMQQAQSQHVQAKNAAPELVDTPTQHSTWNSSKITPLGEYYVHNNNSASSSGGESTGTQEEASDDGNEDDQDSPMSAATTAKPSVSKKAKNLTRDDIGRALSMGLTQERAAEYFSVSLSTFKRRLRTLDFKWPRGKKQRERMGVGELHVSTDSGAPAKAASSAGAPPRSQQKPNSVSRKRKRNAFSDSRVEELNSRLGRVIQDCHDIIFNETLLNFQNAQASQLAPLRAQSLHSSGNTPLTTLLMSQQAPFNANSSQTDTFDAHIAKTQNLLHLCQLLQQRNVDLVKKVIERQRLIEQLQSTLHNDTYARTMDVIYRGDVQSLRGPWNVRKNQKSLAISIMDPYMRLIASNSAWQEMFGYAESDLAVVGGFSTFHKTWPQFTEYSTALKVLQPLLTQNRVKRIRSVGVFKNKFGEHFVVRSTFNIGDTYFWEELELEKDFGKEVTFESDEIQHSIPRVTTGTLVEQCSEQDFLVETFLGFNTFARGVSTITQGSESMVTPGVSALRAMQV